MPSFSVPRRFCGPPQSGNGGYTCGMVAKELLREDIGGQERVGKEESRAVECTLRAPVPLNVPLQFERTPSGAVLRHGDKVIIEAAPTTISVDAPPPISIEAAAKAMASSPALDPCHPFPTCFVCGPHRAVADGLRIFPARVADNLYASTWLPASEFKDAEFRDHQSEAGHNRVAPEFLWAALDCPTGFASGFPEVGTLVTGRLAVQQLKPVKVGEECLLLSWPLGIEGRKHFSAACLYQSQQLCAIARATWIRLGP